MGVGLEKNSGYENMSPINQRKPFRFKNSVDIRRNASEREGLASCVAAHLSNPTRKRSGKRIAVTGSIPVEGRPLFFFSTSFFIVFVIRMLITLFYRTTNNRAKQDVKFAAPQGH